MISTLSKLYETMQSTHSVLAGIHDTVRLFYWTTLPLLAIQIILLILIYRRCKR